MLRTLSVTHYKFNKCELLHISGDQEEFKFAAPIHTSTEQKVFVYALELMFLLAAVTHPSLGHISLKLINLEIH